MLIYDPPAEVHFAVGMQTPGASPAPVHGPLSSERSTMRWPATELAPSRTAMGNNEEICILILCPEDVVLKAVGVSINRGR